MLLTVCLRVEPLDKLNAPCMLKPIRFRLFPCSKNTFRSCGQDRRSAEEDLVKAHGHLVERTLFAGCGVFSLLVS